ncbi:hypothetical protein CRENBAI_015083 [Crenichthys baileyi]|uniref:Uncharacterized protein n=1 Tax=Crenichthys baileyi TaxID=28760 RepID=A0AAV9QRE2_9TELE
MEERKKDEEITSSECEEPQTCPPGPGTDTEEILAKDIQRPPRAQDPSRTIARTTATPQEKSRGESQGNHPAATVQSPSGGCSDEPTGPETQPRVGSVEGRNRPPIGATGTRR